MWNCEITLFSHLFHIIFISFSHFGAQNPGPGPKMAARAGPGQIWAWAPVPGPKIWNKCEINIKCIWRICDLAHALILKSCSHAFHVIFTFSCIRFSYHFHICISSLNMGERVVSANCKARVSCELGLLVSSGCWSAHHESWWLMMTRDKSW